MVERSPEIFKMLAATVEFWRISKFESVMRNSSIKIQSTDRAADFYYFLMNGLSDFDAVFGFL